MSSESPIRAVTFDAGGTLLEPWPSVGHVYAETATRHGMSRFDAATLNSHFAEAWRNKVNFDYSESAWLKLVERTFQSSGAPIPDGFFPDLYGRFGEPGVWRVYEDVVPTLEELADRGIKLAIISNWDTRLRPLLEKMKLAPYFEVLAISGEIGFQKPSPVIFEQALRFLGLPASAVLHVGDSIEEDVEGAREAGLSVLQLDRRNPAAKPGSIRSLTEIATVFRGRL